MATTLGLSSSNSGGINTSTATANSSLRNGPSAYSSIVNGSLGTNSTANKNDHKNSTGLNSSTGRNNNSSSGARTGGSSQYCVLWNNYHSALVSMLGMLRKEGQLLDCTLACVDGGRIHAHQLILAACSTVCREFIKDSYSKHPIILLPSEIGSAELRAMVEFMYTGQVCVEQERLKAFIHGARYLRIKGLEDNSDDTDAEDNEDSPDHYKPRSLKEESKSGSRVHYSGGSNSYRSSAGAADSGGRATEGNSAGADGAADSWQVVERKPIILPQARVTSPGGSRKRRRLTTTRRRPMHLSNSIVCYEQDTDAGGGNNRHQHATTDGHNRHHHSEGSGNYKQEDSSEPINKIRRMSTQQGHYHDDLEICTCSSRKTWSVADTEALLKVWGDTLIQVPPSYFIRSMSLCKRVARNLQARGVQKNWRQCQVKMKNLRREVRLFKESCSRFNTRKPSEVANACEKLLPEIEQIFNKEEEIRQEWYQLKTDDRQREDGGEGGIPSSPTQQDILAQVAVLADSDLGDEDTDGAGLETEGEGGGFTEGEDGVSGGGGGMVGLHRHHHHHHGVVGMETVAAEDIMGVEVTTDGSSFAANADTPLHSVHHQPDGTIHHIVEDVSLRINKQSVEDTATL